MFAVPTVMAEETCDVVIVGSGSAGLAAAVTAADLGKKVMDAQEGSLIGNDENASIILLGSSRITVEIQGILYSGGSGSNSGDTSAYGLSVGEGSTFTNSGSLTVTDKGGTGASSSISGTLSNTGNISIDTDLTVSGTGAVVNSSSMEIAALTAETGSVITNEEDATLNLTDASTVAGTLTNAGTLTSTDLVIYSTAENTGSWSTSGTLTVSGDESNIANSGTIEAGALVMEEGSSIGNNAGSSVTVSGESSVAGSFLSEGTFEANGGLEVTSTGQMVNDTNGTLTIGGDSTVSGQLDNEGAVTVSGTLTVTGEGMLNNGGTVEGDGTLAVEGSARVINAASIKTSGLTVADSGSVVSGGSNASLSADSFSITGGSLEMQDGTFTVGSSELSGGEIALGTGSAVEVELGDPSGDVGTQISVLNGSRLSIGSSEYGLDWADSEVCSKVGNLLVVSAPINTTDTGGISVGTESSGAGLYFSADSTLVVNVDTLGGSAAFTTTSDATATVEAGATLVVGGTFSKGYSYSILDGYTADLAENSWGFDTDNTKYIYGEDNNGLEWS